MHPILQNQNDPSLVRLLEASTVAYTRAKSWEIKITYLLIFLAIAYPITYVITKSEQTKLILFICSFALAILVQVFMDTFKGNTSKGALFKEVFDIELFDLPWKTTLPRPNSTEIDALAKVYKGQPIHNWYSTLLSPSLPSQVAVAVIQYSNTTWDITLRFQYRRLLIFFVCFYSIILLLLILIEQVDPMMTFLLLFSVLSFYIHFISLIRAHTGVIKKREAISRHLDDLIRNKKEISQTALRDIQDEIYLTRLEATKVPNFFFRFYFKQMNERVDGYVRIVNKLYT